MSGKFKIIKRLLQCSFYSLFIQPCRAQFGTKLPTTNAVEVGPTVPLQSVKGQQHLTGLA